MGIPLIVGWCAMPQSRWNRIIKAIKTFKYLRYFARATSKLLLLIRASCLLLVALSKRQTALFRQIATLATPPLRHKTEGATLDELAVARSTRSQHNSQVLERSTTSWNGQSKQTMWMQKSEETSGSVGSSTFGTFAHTMHSSPPSHT